MNKLHNIHKCDSMLDKFNHLFSSCAVTIDTSMLLFSQVSLSMASIVQIILERNQDLLKKLVCVSFYRLYLHVWA